MGDSDQLFRLLKFKDHLEKASVFKGLESFKEVCV